MNTPIVFNVPVTTIKTYEISNELWLALQLYVYTSVLYKRNAAHNQVIYSSLNYADKVSVIKLIREIHKLNLREAKDLVDTFWEQLHAESRERHGWNNI